MYEFRIIYLKRTNLIARSPIIYCWNEATVHHSFIVWSLRMVYWFLHTKKCMLSVWWKIHGKIHFEVLELGQTITVDLYYNKLERLNQALINNYLVIVKQKGIILQHDNGRMHSAKRTDKIKELSREVLPHPPYLPMSHPLTTIRSGQCSIF